MKMKVGTKSILFGAHQFIIHPVFVFVAWWKLYGFPWDPKLWAAFFVHDLGYWGKPNMDQAEGETHVFFGASLMSWLFDKPDAQRQVTNDNSDSYWYYFCLYHSRYSAKQDGAQPSPLCAADKLAMAMEPWWLYLPRVWLSGEVYEYMEEYQLRVKREGEQERAGIYAAQKVDASSMRSWHSGVVGYLTKWVEEHKDGREDTWTPLIVRQNE